MPSATNLAAEKLTKLHPLTHYCSQRLKTVSQFQQYIAGKSKVGKYMMDKCQSEHAMFFLVLLKENNIGPVDPRYFSSCRASHILSYMLR